MPTLNEILEKVDPARDAYPAETDAAEIGAVMLRWREGLTRALPDFGAVTRSLAPQFSGSRFAVAGQESRRSSGDLDLSVRRYAPTADLGGAEFVRALAGHLEPGRILWVDFKITSLVRSAASTETTVLFEFVSTGASAYREQRTGTMKLAWQKTRRGKWLVTRWLVLDESIARSARPMFEDVTSLVLGRNASYREQLAHGTDYWRSILDGASGIDIYGNYGVAFGDIDNDGWDELYVCQPAGLPNRLYRNRRDGTFDDISSSAGVDVLDSCPSALFADVDNDGRQDLIVVSGSGPLLFLNQGGGRFHLQERAFKFATKPQGTFTGAAIADYDRDGWLDVYLCLYSYYQGPDRYRYPVPYDKAQNGPPNFLFRNNRDGTFADATHAARLNVNNNRFSFACGWCDYDQDGWPDLFVANDFGQKNLYHNNGDGSFTDLASEAGVLDTGAGMSVCWFDYNHDGRPDLYVADMWTAAGLRVTEQADFMPDAPPRVRALYRKHAMGNSLFRNNGRGGFDDQTAISGTGMGRWAWSSDAWDFDQDGYDDLYIANGMISGPKQPGLSSFFWRQVVARSPAGSSLTPAYEQGWNAINELIRSDSSWDSYERNILYANNRDGTFTDVSGAVGLDCIEDSRSFALADIDHDGRLELVVKNRSAPQVRVFRNVMRAPGNSVVFRLKGSRSNRDAIGASVRVRSEDGEQIKFVQAGSGFLAQHSKELFFGLGPSQSPLRVTVRWPAGVVQKFEDVPVNRRIEIEEGRPGFQAVAYERRANSEPAQDATDGRPAAVPYAERERLPTSFSSWLLAPIASPDFSLPDLSGRTYTLSRQRGEPLVLLFWVSPGDPAVRALRAFQHRAAQVRSSGVTLWALNIDDPRDETGLRSLAQRHGITLPILLATPDVAAVYNLLYRYTFDRRRDMELPACFLLDKNGLIVKIYQGEADPARIRADAAGIPRTKQERVAKALPFAGASFRGEFNRNDFTFGVIFAQHGYGEAAEAAFLRAIRNEPSSADAHYDLGTLYMRQEKWVAAEAQLRKAAALEPHNLMALNNLGVIAAQQGQITESEQYFSRVLNIDPANVLALGNLADLDRQQGRYGDAVKLLVSALDRQPNSAQLNYKLGMLFAKVGENTPAEQYLRKAVELDPGDAEAMDNLGVLFALTGQTSRAAETFSECIRRAPKFDQAYLNLARIDLKLGKPRKAAGVLRALLKEIPGHPLALEFLKKLGESPQS